MMACEWIQTSQVKLADRDNSTITDPQDVIVKVTCTTICGSDLHEYLNENSWNASNAKT